MAVAQEFAIPRRAIRPVSLTRARWQETLVVRMSLVAITVYLIDDAFLQPESGRSARDHLVSGSLPAGILLVVAVIYPWFRTGLRAWLTLAIGVLALGTGAAVPVAHVVGEGPSGDDFSGLVATLAGLALAIAGATTLWERRANDGRFRRYTRRFLVGVAAVVVLAQIIAPIGLAFRATHVPRTSVAAADLGAPYEEVTFTTGDGLRLSGWYVPSRNGAAVIAFPGRSGPVAHARMLVRHGYGVLLFDPRGRGESEGDPNAFGWGGERDLLAAIAFLQNRPDVDPDRIGGLGLSVGGELMLQTAAATDALAAVVSEGAGIRSVREQLRTSGTGKWLDFPMWAMTTTATAVFANQVPPPDLGDLLAQIAPRPIFLIYATHGQGGEELNPVYDEAAGQPKELWAIPEADHTGGLTARPDEYERRVIAFFDGALLTPGSTRSAGFAPSASPPRHTFATRDIPRVMRLQ